MRGKTRTVRRLAWSAAVLALSLAPAWRAPAQDHEFRKSLEEFLKKGSDEFQKDFSRFMDEQTRGFADALAQLVAQHYTGRIEKLEKALAEKEQRIAQLEKALAAARAGAEKKPQPEVVRKATNAFLGVGHIDHDRGALVTTVHPESPAAKAGIQPNDIIASVGDKTVTSENLGAAITAHDPGSTVQLTVLRGNEKKTLSATLADREAFFAERAREAAKPEEESVVLGVTVEEVPGGGLTVEEVEEGFTGHVAGLTKGDRILKVNEKAVKTLEEISSAVKACQAGKPLALTVERGEEVVTITVVGAAGKGGAKLVSRAAVKKEGKEEPAKEAAGEKKPAAERKPAYLGVRVIDLDGGVRVDEVIKGSAAAAYGIQPGDVLRQVNGKDVGDVSQLISLVRALAAGDKISVLLRRGGKEVKIDTIVLGAPDEEFKKPEAAAKPAASGEKPPAERKRGVLGIRAEETDDNQVVVVDVLPGSAAEKGGLKAGDVLLKVGDRAITNFDTLAEALKAHHAGDALTLRIRRGEEEKDVPVTLGEPGAGE